jgi:mRNA-degrading endonuclease RelE of RelBE toxin-antitoxin system
MAKNKKIKVGDQVRWHDPAIADYSPADRKIQKKIVYVVDEISEDDAWIYDVTMTPVDSIQVAPWELELVDPYRDLCKQIDKLVDRHYDNLDEYMRDLQDPEPVYKAVRTLANLAKKLAKQVTSNKGA